MIAEETTPPAPENTLKISLAIFLPPLFLALPFYNFRTISFLIFFATLIPYAIGALSFHYYANKKGITKASDYIGAGALAALAISFLLPFLNIARFFDVFLDLLTPLLPVCMLHSFVFWSFAVNKKPIYKIIAVLLYIAFSYQISAMLPLIMEGD